MENASKALLMAGEILIAILIISVIVYMFTAINNSIKSKDDIKKIEQIENYNKEFESYNRKLLRGTDVVSLINKAINTNDKYEEIEEYYINIEVEMADGKKYNIDSFDSVRNNEEKFKDFKSKVFDCNSDAIQYNTAGRVSYMKFIERTDYTL